MRRGWLLAQLPEVMRADKLLAALVLAFEEVADTVVVQVDSIEHQLDVSVAPRQQLRFLASWIGLVLDTAGAGDGSDEADRELVRAVGRTLGARGTRRALEELLGAATGFHVEVGDSGGIFGQADQVPVPDNRISVVADSLGPLSRAQVLAISARELPVGCVIDLQVLAADESGAS